jgi:N-acetyl-S-(2-succino)cysteine monooxygenase
MKKSLRQMKLGLFLLNMGHHIAAWKHPNAQPAARLDFNYYQKLANTAEQGMFDMLFMSDFLGMPIQYTDDAVLAKWGNAVRFEPLMLLSALATTTKNIGLVATASTTYHEPYTIARKFASIDFLSQGRAGWNVVTSATHSEALNHHLETQIDHRTRYLRAQEFMQVVTGLWNGWEDDAFLFDKNSGFNFDPHKMHTLNYKGDFFAVKGPLNIARPPQGYPVIVQAGSSEDGKAFGSRWADVIFTAHQTVDQAKLFYHDMKQLAEKANRSPEDIKIMPGIMPIIGKTKTQAREKYEYLQTLIDEQLGLSLLSTLLGEVLDLSNLSPHEKLPPLPVTEGNMSRQHLIYQQAQQNGLTIRELYKDVAGARGHHVVIGTPKDIADEMEYWFNHGAADGFNIMPAQFPDHLDDFVNLVIPELQSRNLFRKNYMGSTLREHLGLSRPRINQS